ncbi:MAG: ATP synthase F0 subunit C [Planctomycetota bacterium]
MEYGAIAVAFAMALAVSFGALSQGKAISHAVDAMARQPETANIVRGALIIYLAFIESLVIFMALIAILLWTKLPAAH